MHCVLFCHPFGAGYVIALTKGFTLGYILSALRACCRATCLYPLAISTDILSLRESKLKITYHIGFP